MDAKNAPRQAALPWYPDRKFGRTPHPAPGVLPLFLCLPRKSAAMNRNPLRLTAGSLPKVHRPKQFLPNTAPHRANCIISATPPRIDLAGHAGPPNRPKVGLLGQLEIYF